MTLRWKIDHDERLVTVKTSDELGFHELEAYLRDVANERALSFRKLWDAREGRTLLGGDEIRSYVATVSRFMQWRPLGPYAVVVGPDQGLAHDSLLSRLLATRERSIRLFADIAKAQDWLRLQPLPGKEAGL
jgi:hypothetical protein